MCMVREGRLPFGLLVVLNTDLISEARMTVSYILIFPAANDLS